LLKHPFLKKAKDRRYLVQTCLNSAPTLEARAQKVRNYRKTPGASGRLHRTEAGDWVWSSDSEADGEDHSDGDSDAEATCRHDAVAQAAPVQVNPATETQHSGSSTGSNISGSTSGSNTSDQTAASLLQQQPEQQAEVASMTPTPVVADSVSQSPPPASVTSESQPINLVLRMRNIRRELNDIRFEFCIGRDTADGIASELVAAGLVDGRDLVVIAANLQKVLHGSPASKTVTFALSSGCVGNEVPDDKALLGFAQLSITD